MELGIFIPNVAFRTTSHIAPGSGIVGQEHDMAALPPRSLIIYYEGNLYRMENLRTYEERVRMAASRLLHRAPTIAKMLVSPDDVLRVGSYSVSDERIYISNLDALATWLGPE